jgi:hypothetical protein
MVYHSRKQGLFGAVYKNHFVVSDSVLKTLELL